MKRPTLYQRVVTGAQWFVLGSVVLLAWTAIGFVIGSAIGR